MDEAVFFEAVFSVIPIWGFAMTRAVYIDFPPSTATDVVEYRLFYEPSPGPVTQASPWVSLGNPPPVGGIITVDVTTIPDFAEIDGVFELGLAAVDDAGNVSEALTVAHSVPLDFVAPPAPASITVRFG